MTSSALVDEIRDATLTRLSAELGAHRVGLRAVVDELYALHMVLVTTQTRVELSAWRGWRQSDIESLVEVSALRAMVEINADRRASRLALAIAERKVGEVLVAPSGVSLGATPVKQRTWIEPKELI